MLGEGYPSSNSTRIRYSSTARQSQNMPATASGQVGNDLLWACFESRHGYSSGYAKHKQNTQ